MMRILNICVIAALVAAAAYVYKIKFESTRQAERVAKLRMEIRREHDAIAALRAEWSKLDNPLRIETLAQRHLALKSIDARQFDRLDRLPERPPELVPLETDDPIAFLIDKPDLMDIPTASVTLRGKKK
jgi:cell division protein FtsL